MRVILGALVIALVIAVGAGVFLNAMQKTVYQSQPMSSVRLGDPGSNLVGPDWSGEPSPGEPRQEANRAGRQQ